MKSADELNPIFDDLCDALKDVQGANPFISGMVTILSLVLERPDICGTSDCTENHDDIRDRWIANMRARVAKRRAIREKQERARRQ